MTTDNVSANNPARQDVQHFIRISSKLMDVLQEEISQIFPPDTPAEEAATTFALSAMQLTAIVLATCDKYVPAREMLAMLDKMVADSIAE